MVEMIEGPQAWKRFKRGMKALMGVPRDEVLQKEREHQEQAAKNTNRPGPKPKRKRR